MRRLILLAVVAAGLTPLPGATLLQLSLDDMIQKSTAIVDGTVRPTHAAFRGAMIYTHYEVQVRSTLKGVAAPTWDVAVPGGTVSAIQQYFAGAPALASGKDYLLFLWTSKTGLTQVIGLSQGLFNVSHNSSGESIVSRGATSETMLNASGQVITDSNIRMTLAEMRSRIQTVLAGGTGK